MTRGKPNNNVVHVVSQMIIMMIGGLTYKSCGKPNAINHFQYKEVYGIGKNPLKMGWCKMTPSHGWLMGWFMIEFTTYTNKYWGCKREQMIYNDIYIYIFKQRNRELTTKAGSMTNKNSRVYIIRNIVYSLWYVTTSLGINQTNSTCTRWISFGTTSLKPTLGMVNSSNCFWSFTVSQATTLVQL